MKNIEIIENLVQDKHNLDKEIAKKNIGQNNIIEYL